MVARARRAPVLRARHAPALRPEVGARRVRHLLAAAVPEVGRRLGVAADHNLDIWPDGLERFRRLELVLD